MFHSPAGQGDPNKIRRGVVNCLRELRFVRFGPLPKRRTDRADDVDVGLQLDRGLLERFENFLGIAKEKMPP